MSEQLTAYDGLLPTGVAVADSRVDLNVPLFLEEEERASSMVVSRRADFVTVRACARLALGRLGVPPVPLVPGEAGEPSWPNGIVGSMTHCRGLRAAAVALTGPFTVSPWSIADWAARACACRRSAWAR